MNDDSLRATWTTTQLISKEALVTTINAVIAEDRAAQDKERRVRVIATLAMALLCPPLLWFSAHGKTPLVRGGYALMAVGVATILFAEWVHRKWSRQSLPGPDDARSQLQKTALFLSHQTDLLRTAPVWCSPIFIGAALVGTWLYEQRGAGEASLFWAGIGAGWLVISITGFTKGRKLDERRSRIEAALSDLDCNG